MKVILRNAINKFHPALWQWFTAAILIFVYIYFKQPQQVPVIVYKAGQFCGAVYTAHLIDNMFFQTFEGEPRDIVMGAKEIARAIVFMGTVLGLTLGI